MHSYRISLPPVRSKYREEKTKNREKNTDRPPVSFTLRRLTLLSVPPRFLPFRRIVGESTITISLYCLPILSPMFSSTLEYSRRFVVVENAASVSERGRDENELLAPRVDRWVERNDRQVKKSAIPFHEISSPLVFLPSLRLLYRGKFLAAFSLRATLRHAISSPTSINESGHCHALSRYIYIYTYTCISFSIFVLSFTFFPQFLDLISFSVPRVFRDTRG